MVFASLEFITLFFPIFLIGYFFTPAIWRNLCIIVFSWLFYSWWAPAGLPLLIVVTIGVWLSGLWLSLVKTKHIRQLVLGLAIAMLTTLLVYYKYANLFSTPLSAFVNAISDAPYVWAKVILPIGISFIVLQTISYLTDIYRGHVVAERSLIAFAAYKAMFAPLIAGPIVRYSHVANELYHRTFDASGFANGLRRFMIGLSMKVIIADTLAPFADACFALTAPTMLDAWLGTIAYGLQLFFDFAGYSTMAIGIGMMLGFHFPENFNSPYIAKNIQDFWRRWHMSLGGWLRDYIYVPLGGNKVGIRLSYVNLMILMLISGLWHGAESVNFVLWGGMHGIAMIIHRIWGRAKLWAMPSTLAWVLTMLFVFSSWTLFRAPSLEQALSFYQAQWSMQGMWLSPEIDNMYRLSIALTGMIAIFISLIPVTFPYLNRVQLFQTVLWQRFVWIWPLLGFLWATMLMSSRGSAPFLYFQF